MGEKNQIHYYNIKKAKPKRLLPINLQKHHTCVSFFFKKKRLATWKQQTVAPYPPTHTHTHNPNNKVFLT